MTVSCANYSAAFPLVERGVSCGNMGCEKLKWGAQIGIPLATPFQGKFLYLDNGKLQSGKVSLCGYKLNETNQ